MKNWRRILFENLSLPARAKRLALNVIKLRSFTALKIYPYRHEPRDSRKWCDVGKQNIDD